MTRFRLTARASSPIAPPGCPRPVCLAATSPPHNGLIPLSIFCPNPVAAPRARLVSPATGVKRLWEAILLYYRRNELFVNLSVSFHLSHLIGRISWTRPVRFWTCWLQWVCAGEKDLHSPSQRQQRPLIAYSFIYSLVLIHFNVIVVVVVFYHDNNQRQWRCAYTWIAERHPDSHLVHMTLTTIIWLIWTSVSLCLFLLLLLRTSNFLVKMPVSNKKRKA